MAKLADKAELEEIRKKLQSKRRKEKKKLISLCAGSGCGAYGTARVHQALVDELKKQELENKVEVKLTGCHGFCEKGPGMVIHPEGIFYPQVKEKHVPEIVEETLKKGELVKSLIFKDPTSKKRITFEEDIPFYKLQQREIFGGN
ncbi:MAG: (2Fe-2S) ferredoxin domain-containing protein, partial [Desulfobacterales bacterium]